jgi:hypothetical protein
MLLFTGLLGAMVVGLTTASDRAAESNPAAPASTHSPGARSASWLSAIDDLDISKPSRTWTSIVLHHSATRGGDVASIDAVHRRQKDRQGRPWLGIGYHFVVGNGHPMGDGEVQATFRWRQQLSGAHAGQRDYNDHGIGICLIGNFDEADPTKKQLAAVGQLVRQLAERHAIGRERVIRHQDVHPTACPGRRFPWEQLLTELPTRPNGT